MMSPVRSLVAAAASPAMPRPSRGAACCMCGRTGALSLRVTRWRGRKISKARMIRKTIAMTIAGQYPWTTSISSPIPLCVVATAELAQIGDEQAQKKPQQRGRRAFNDQRDAAACRPGRPLDARHIADDPDQLAALEIVRGAGKQHGAGERPAVEVAADLRNLPIDDGLANRPLDRRGVAVRSPQRAVPQDRERDCRDDADRYCHAAPAARPKSECANERADDQSSADRRP